MIKEAIEKSSFYNREDDSWVPGDEIIIKRSIWDKKLDITPLIKLNKEELEKMHEKSKLNEHEIFKKIYDLSRKWEEIACETYLLSAAIEYLSVEETDHTNNVWVLNEDRWGDIEEEISNRTYRMYIRFRKSLNRYVVIWRITTNAPQTNLTIVAPQKEVIFNDKEKALRYISGRKQAYSHLFTEINPKVPTKYKEPFIFKDLLLPGYELENV